jgi:uracil-DNA glycosylase
MTWEQLLAEEMQKEYFLNLATTVKSNKDFCPGVKSMFRAFELVEFDDITVVVLGQDPYHGENQANGLAFSVTAEQRLPPSLRNIFVELHSDVGVQNTSGDLSSWAKQGVLLMNSILTVLPDKPASHANIGWEIFTDKIISDISEHLNGVVFMLWGAYARSKGVLINTKKHLVLACPHPSPLSAHTGFFGCKHFSHANEFLMAQGKKMIDWRT